MRSCTVFFADYLNLRIMGEEADVTPFDNKLTTGSDHYKHKNRYLFYVKKL